MTINIKNFLNDKSKLSRMGEFQNLKKIEGLEMSSISADLYNDGRDDVALFYFSKGANYATLYTTNSITSDFSQIYVLRKKQKSFQAFHLDITDPTRVSLSNLFEMRPDDIVFVATQPLSLYSRALSQILGSTGLTLQARDTIRAEINN